MSLKESKGYVAGIGGRKGYCFNSIIISKNKTITK